MKLDELKPRKTVPLGLFVVWCIVTSPAFDVARAQNFAIDWFTIDGGGGTSTGGIYAVSGTIGQPDAGNANGADYVLDGGFWGIFATPTLGMPTLVIMPAGLGMATISWSPNAPGFVLQMNNAVENPAGWSDAPTGGANPASVATSGEKTFYRLRKP